MIAFISSTGNRCASKVRARTHTQFVNVMLNRLLAAGLLESQSGQWRVICPFSPTDSRLVAGEISEQYPQYAPETDLVSSICFSMSEILSGETAARELMLPADSGHLVDAFHAGAAETPVFVRLLKSVVADCVENLPSRRALRVLEIGAGAGALAHEIVDVLPCERLDYLIADSDQEVLSAARLRLKDNLSVDYKLLDIEGDLLAQGISAGNFDIVLASHTLHKTRDLPRALANIRTCLAPDGMLLFVERINQAVPVWTFG